jgi:ribosome maturation factor RimP
MSADPAVKRVWEIAAPLIADEGMEILEIECRYEGKQRGRVLRVYLDKEDGPSLDDLSRISRQLSDLLDVHDPVEGPYTLEVSSPGINRVLKKKEHFARFVGKRVRVRSREAIGGKRSFLGVLKEVREDGITVQEKSDVDIPFGLIDKANYEHDWRSPREKR